VAVTKQHTLSVRKPSANFEQRLLRAWYEGASWLILLRPFSWFFRAVVGWRKKRLLKLQDKGWKSPVPLIVVGNIAVGGTGKTPLVIALVERLREAGYRPGVISRGYGANPPETPWLVTRSAPVEQVGDEALLIALRADCPVVIDPDRVSAAQALLAQDCDLIISDDGLQHYRLARDLELLVIDGQRGMGNGQCLPEGPLREPASRIKEVDFIVVNGACEMSFDQHAATMVLRPTEWVRLEDGKRVAVNDWQGKRVTAVAGIGNPQRFFASLRDLGLQLEEERTFPDHWAYSPEDLLVNEGQTLVMTEKDAVKCCDFASGDCWYLSIDADIDPLYINEIIDKVNVIKGIK
jgi:tetraacyldisaccharide 4'-kinase